jgi:hypothetical protein
MKVQDYLSKIQHLSDLEEAGTILNWRLERDSRKIVYPW